MNKAKSNHDLTQDPIIIGKPLMDKIMNGCGKDWCKVYALYSFYYYTARWQKTNQPKATTEYAAKGMHCTEDTIRKYKKKLIELELIENVVTRKNDKISGHYIRVNFIWTKEKTEQYTPNRKPVNGKPNTGEKLPLEKSLGLEKNGANALSSNKNINALSSNKKTTALEKSPKRTAIVKKKTTSISSSGKTLSTEQKTGRQLNKSYIPFSLQLARCINKKYNIKTPVAFHWRWAAAFRYLHIVQGISKFRIRKALCWYTKNINMPYQFQVTTGEEFCSKFLKIEAKMNNKPLPKQATDPDIIIDPVSGKQVDPEWIKQLEEHQARHTTVIHNDWKKEIKK